jgi:hypothetical protein
MLAAFVLPRCARQDASGTGRERRRHADLAEANIGIRNHSIDEKARPDDYERKI